jgi:hypothetical protein
MGVLSEVGGIHKKMNIVFFVSISAIHLPDKSKAENNFYKLPSAQYIRILSF